mgnify:CR=1 FL=1
MVLRVQSRLGYLEAASFASLVEARLSCSNHPDERPLLIDIQFNSNSNGEAAGSNCHSNSKLVERLVLPDESPLQLVERPSACRLLDKLAVDVVLIKLV